MINSKTELQELAKQLGVRPEWHETDEQDLTIIITGTEFDNASVENEICISIAQNGKVVEVINLATLLAIACQD